MKKLFSHLTFQVILAILAGILVGANFPAFAPTAKLISQIFINMISMLIAPVIFTTIVLGIANMKNLKKVGRVGGKALLYFEVVTTFAIVIGLIIANVVKPGNGVAVNVHTDAGKINQYQAAAAGFNWGEFILHIVPNNIFKSFAEADILQILFFAVLFGYALSKLGSDGRPVIGGLEKISRILFNIMRVIMRFAPVGAFGGMAFTIGTYGLSTLLPMGKLMLSVYLTMAGFIFIVLNVICHMYKISLWQYLKFVRQEILVVLGTSSSESVLPSMMEKMEQFGCSRSVVGLVIPTGYSFNLDGTSIYLSMAVLFLSQVFHVDLSLEQQLTIIGILMVTSKGAAAITGGGFIVLASTLTALKIIPVEGIAVLLGVDRFMSEARAITNMIGNGIATVVISKSEKEFDEAAYQRVVSGKLEEVYADS